MTPKDLLIREKNNSKITDQRLKEYEFYKAKAINAIKNKGNGAVHPQIYFAHTLLQRSIDDLDIAKKWLDGDYQHQNPKEMWKVIFDNASGDMFNDDEQ